MISNANISQYSPESEDNTEDQPLDFSKTARISPARKKSGSTSVKNEPEFDLQKSTNSSNYLTTPSPSPPEQHSNQVLCQLLTGNLIPTPTGKVIPARSQSLSHPFNGVRDDSPSPISRSPSDNGKHQNRVVSSIDHHNSSLSPPASESPIGLGPLNQVDLNHFASPNSSGIERFGSSGGLLTTAVATGVMNAFPGNDAKRSLKYSRPFKAYPRDPLSIPMGYYSVPIQTLPLTADAIATQSILATQSDQAYLQFREQMLVQRKSSQPSRPHTKTTHNNCSNGNANSNASNANSNGNVIQPTLSKQETRVSPQNLFHSSTPNTNERTSLERGQSEPSTPKTNGSSLAAMPASQVHIDENSQYSNENSSGAEGEGGSMSSTPGTGSGHSAGSNMRKRGRPLPEDLKDEAYWERRRKNNEAAKRSRDARRAKEDEIAIRAAFLESENMKLRCEVAQLKSEVAKLRLLLYNN